MNVLRVVTISLAACLAVAGVACVRAYRPPRADQPHAVVKLRRVYQTPESVTLHESMQVNGNEAYSADTPSESSETPRTDAILIHPVPAAIEVSAGFSHTEVRTVTEQYTVQVPYQTTESYSCGSYSGGHYSSRTCSRSVTRYRSETRTRVVTKPVPVSDGACSNGADLAPEVGHVYLVEYRYLRDGVCEVSCFEQIPAGPGTFRNQACPAPPMQPE